MGELNLLQKKIMKDGVIKAGNVLKVDSFLNHQIDVPFISELGKEFKKLFGDRQVDKILTIRSVRYRHCLSHCSIFRGSGPLCQKVGRQQYG